jgi:hypothetical protein
MNCQKFDMVVFWEHFSFDTKQALICSTFDVEDQGSDQLALFGETVSTTSLPPKLNALWE